MLILHVSATAQRIYESDPEASMSLGNIWVADEVVRQNPLTFRLQPNVLDAHSLATSNAIAQTRDGPEATALEAALKEDAKLGPLAGKTLYSASQGSPISSGQIVSDFLEVALRRRPLEATPENALQSWRDFLGSYFAPREQLTMIAPLRNFEGPSSPIALGEGLELDYMTNEELSRAIQIGAVNSPLPTAPGMVWVISRWGLRIQYELNRKIGEGGDTTAFAEADAGRQVAMRQLEGVLQALRLFRAEYVSAETALLFASSEAKNPGLGLWMQWFPLSGAGVRGGANYPLNDEDAVAFAQFHQDVVRARDTHRPLDGAIRRFGYAGERSRPDDQLTDLIIALEAVLLDDSERGEKRFQVAMRVAALVAIEGSTRRDVFQFLKRAYDVRSAIVHGGNPRLQLLKNLAGEPVELQEFADISAEVTRALLKRVVEICKETGSFGIDWELELLGEA